ncbi:hypothetical protein ANN_27983 [Periplaneta americana]|uniref:Uncharacterized protein n=1 Tax=Periplaneta americana TaxID=6978 RepID=A0ABQ8RUE0_PERAM|nr:hypothetical protein ANN_27983 [Periplaneta americana]
MDINGEIIPSILLIHKDYMYNLHSGNSSRTKEYEFAEGNGRKTGEHRSTKRILCRSAVYKVDEHVHPPPHEEVDAVHRCTALNQAAPAQIIERELERLPSDMLQFFPLRKSLKRSINQRRQRNFSANPKSVPHLPVIPPDLLS